MENKNKIVVYNNYITYYYKKTTSTFTYEEFFQNLKRDIVDDLAIVDYQKESERFTITQNDITYRVIIKADKKSNFCQRLLSLSKIKNADDLSYQKRHFKIQNSAQLESKLLYLEKMYEYKDFSFKSVKRYIENLFGDFEDSFEYAIEILQELLSIPSDYFEKSDKLIERRMVVQIAYVLILFLVTILTAAQTNVLDLLLFFIHMLEITVSFGVGAFLIKYAKNRVNRIQNHKESMRKTNKAIQDTKSYISVNEKQLIDNLSAIIKGNHEIKFNAINKEELREILRLWDEYKENVKKNQPAGIEYCQYVGDKINELIQLFTEIYLCSKRHKKVDTTELVKRFHEKAKRLKLILRVAILESDPIKKENANSLVKKSSHID